MNNVKDATPNLASDTKGLPIDLDVHVLPVLHLARLAIALEYALTEVDKARAVTPDLNGVLKLHGLATDVGQSIAPYADMAILSAIDMIEVYARGQRNLVGAA